jgi:hypothetical protein
MRAGFHLFPTMLLGVAASYSVPDSGVEFASALANEPIADAAMQATARQFHAAYHQVVTNEQKSSQRAAAEAGV